MRLRRFYRRAGFFQPAIDYEVRTNDPGTVVDVSYVIEEGPATVLGSVLVVGPAGSASLALPDSLTASWSEFEAALAAAPGPALRRGESRGGTGQPDRLAARPWLPLREGAVGAHGRLPAAGGGRAPGGESGTAEPHRGRSPSRGTHPSATRSCCVSSLSAPVTAIRPGRWPRHERGSRPWISWRGRSWT